ncbi:YitT family protein [Lacticaseibacillus zhaodongensis]|uniref:YitT family protein n=1 Tax=Lacticaseibacillus zhaodongensis TaxID=2668065 RepID=UPI0012D2BA4B|nr:YitT family protein [Lacticaseibacillus zhaodongensis]
MHTVRTKSWLKLVFITAALAIIALSINNFFAPHGVAAGGATGLAIIVQEVAGVPTYVSTLVINIIMLILAWLLLSRATTARILYGSFMLPVLMAILPSSKIVADRTLAIMVGSVTMAVGFTMLYAVDASSGGTTVPPLIFKKYFGLKPATGLLLVDVAVSLLNIPVSGLEAFILAVFSLVITNVAMNYIQTGLDRRLLVHVFSSEQLDAIKTALRKSLGGDVQAVLISGTEGNWGHDMLMVVVDQPYYKAAVNIIHGIDSHALIIAGEVAEVQTGK